MNVENIESNDCEDNRVWIHDHFFNLIEYLADQYDWSENTFGPGPRPLQCIDHIRKELVEIFENPNDVMEWIDVAMLAFDGAMRAGHSPKQVAFALQKKLEINKNRRWPDWRTMPKGKAIEHLE